MYNRLANCHNRFQTGAKRVLCLCSAGLLRSPTTANVLHQKYGYNTRAAGVTPEFALVPVDRVLLEWADEVVCVEMSVADKLAEFQDSIGFPPEQYHKTVTVLNIPDKYEWNEPELRMEIERQYAEFIAAETKEA